MYLQAMRLDKPSGPAVALKVAVVLDSLTLPAWKASVIDDFLEADFIELTVIVIAQNPEHMAEMASGHWLFQEYAMWDSSRVREACDPFCEVDVSDRLKQCRQRLDAEQFNNDEIVLLDLDVVVWLASSEPDRSLQAIPRFGLWFYPTEQPQFFWEIYTQDPITKAVLEVLGDEENAASILYESYSATEQGWSWERNKAGPTLRAATFPLRCLRRLYEKQADGLSGLKLAPKASASIVQRPTNLQMGSFILRNAFRTVSRRLRFSHKESSWFVGYRMDSRRFISNSETLNLNGFKPLEAPPDHFYADPFVIEWRGKDYIFVEDYLFAESRGCISVLEIDAKGVASEAHRVLDRPYHLSYPFVFEHDEDLYMIPETLAATSIELYRAVEAPTRWEFVKTLKADVHAVDTTLWLQDGLFFFFTNIAARGATVNDELSLFVAESLLGEWKPHPDNPLVTDVRRSRGAGKLFRRNGKLIRPSQDCAVRYGYACQLNEVELLTTTHYQEKPLQRIEPNWAPGLIGTHTLNSNARIEVIDGQVYRRRYRKKN